MDTELLKTFLIVRELGHFGKAAETLKITQSAVSLRIKHLEDELDAPLFFRYRNNLQLTDPGERFILYAEKILKEWDNAKLDITMRKQNRKIIRFGATNGFCSILLKHCMKPIYQNNRDITLKVFSQDEESLRSRLREKRIDLVLLYEALKDQDFVSTPVSNVELALVSTTRGMTQEQVLQGDYVAVEWGSFFNTRFLELSSQMPSPVLQVTKCDFALQFILDNGGSAYLPYRLVEPYLGTSLHLVDDAQILNQPIYAIHARSSPLKNDIEAITSILVENSRPVFSSLDDVMKEFHPVDEPLLAVV